MITHTAKYAIKTLQYMAQQDQDTFVQTRELGEKLDIPSNYLGKTLQKLAKARILESQKGLHGGFRCEKNPAKVTLYSVLQAIDAFPETVALLRDDDLPPLFHDRFEVVRSAYERFLRETTIADLVEPASKPTPAPQSPAAATESPTSAMESSASTTTSPDEPAAAGTTEAEALKAIEALLDA